MSDIQQDKELREQLSEMVERDAMALCCNDCEGGGYDYENTKDCSTCKGTGLTEWRHDYLIDQLVALIQARDKDIEHKAHIDELWLLEHGAKIAGNKFSVEKYLEIRRKEISE